LRPSRNYLLRITLLEGNYSEATALLHQSDLWLEQQEFQKRQLLYDLFTGFFYLQIQLPELAAPWLISDAIEDVGPKTTLREAFLRAKFLITAGKYYKAMEIISKTERQTPEELFLFGELSCSISLAVARHKIGDVPGAIAALERAWQLSFSGELEMPFIEFGKSMRALVVAAQQANCVIPEGWLKSIELKASGYAKRVASIATAYKKDNRIEDAIRLSERERQTLGDLYQGLSRAEIAASRYLSVNTVKANIQMLYAKLGASNNVDAVRIAIEKHLI